MMKTFTRFSVLPLVCLLFACKKDLVPEELTASQSRQSNQLVSDCGMLRTQTPGGWGSKPAGNNPGAYLHAHFNDAFGDGLIVGCYPGANYVRLTTAQSITDLLPTGGPAAQLTVPVTNPASIRNVLVGHLVALKLSVGFDAYDAGFGESDVNLGDMVIGSGAFKDWSVAQFLSEADDVLGGCNADFTPGQVLETAAAINENYVDGKENKGYLACPGPIIVD